MGDALIKPVTSVWTWYTVRSACVNEWTHWYNMLQSFYSPCYIRQLRKYLTYSLQFTVMLFCTTSLTTNNSVYKKFVSQQRVLSASYQNTVTYHLYWKTYTQSLPRKIASNLQENLIREKPHGCHHLRSDKKVPLAVPKSKCKSFVDRTQVFNKAGPLLWNSLPNSSRHLTDL